MRKLLLLECHWLVNFMNPSLSSQTPSSSPKSLLGQFLKFLRRPHYTINVSQDHQGIIDILRLYSLVLLIVLPLGVLSASVAANLQASNAVEDFAKTVPIGQIFLLAVVLAPLWEEAAFRLPLRYTPINLAIPISLGVLLLLSVLISSNVLPAGIGLPMLLAIILLGVMLRLWLKEVSPKKIHTFYAKWIGWFFYGSAISFGLIHLGNFTSFEGQAWLLAPLLVLPQTALGVFLGFIRLKHGFWWAVFTHAFHNACAITPLMLMRLGSEDLLNSLEKGTNPQNLVGTDYVVLLVLTVFVFGGLLLCLLTVRRLIVEWRSEKRHEIIDSHPHS